MPTAADYDALEVIGQGSFGSIRKVRRKVDGVIMARKEIRYEKMEAKERDQLTSEFSILSALRHPNIVEYHHREHVKEHQMVYIYMEYCGGGDLSGLLKDLRKKGTSLREDVVWSIFVQLVSALYRCHYGVDPPENPPNTRNQAPSTHTRGNTVIHRDLKPENVFLDENNLVKLGDFGLSKMLGSEHQMAMTYVGTPLYMSPELVSDTPYTVKTDIWSLGCIMYELCTLKPPFTAKTPHQLFHTIKQGRFDPIPNYYSAELRAVIEQCLRCEPKERPEASQLLFMPAMQIYRKQRDMVLLRKQLQVRENILNTRESRIIAKEREIENRLVAKNNALIARERELMGKEGELIAKERALMAKEQELMVKERDMRQILEERSHSIREHIDMELRNEWTIKAEIEVMQQVEIQKMNLETQFEFEVNQRVEAQVRQRVEEQLSHRVEMEVERRMAGLNLVPVQIASLHSAHSSSTSSQQSAETSITSVHSSFRSPARRGLVPFGAPDSPNDVDMASPARDQEPIPTNPDNVFEEKPQGQGLRQSLFHKQLLEHRYSDPNPLANTNMNDLLDESEDEIEHFRKSENSTPLSRVTETGSPFKRDVGPIRRSKTTTAVNLFPTSKRTSLGPDESNMLKTATTNSLNQNENPLRGKAIFELAKRRDEELKSSRTTPREEVATWDPEKDEMPSPFMVRTRRDYPI